MPSRRSGWGALWDTMRVRLHEMGARRFARGAARMRGDEDKSREELAEELARVRRRLAALESPEGARERAEEASRGSEERLRFALSPLASSPGRSP